MTDEIVPFACDHSVECCKRNPNRESFCTLGSPDHFLSDRVKKLLDNSDLSANIEEGQQEMPTKNKKETNMTETTITETSTETAAAPPAETEKKKRKAYVCTYCGGTGHNKRTCPKRKADEAEKAAIAICNPTS
jgi:hypothetical protein